MAFSLRGAGRWYRRFFQKDEDRGREQGPPQVTELPALVNSLRDSGKALEPPSSGCSTETFRGVLVRMSSRRLFLSTRAEWMALGRP